MTNKKKTANLSHINECVIEPEIRRVSSEVHPLAVLVIMPPHRVLPSVNLLVASETHHPPPCILDMSFTLPAPTEVFPAGIAGPLSLGSLERTGLAAARFMRGQRWVLGRWR